MTTGILSFLYSILKARADENRDIRHAYGWLLADVERIMLIQRLDEKSYKLVCQRLVEALAMITKRTQQTEREGGYK